MNSPVLPSADFLFTCSLDLLRDGEASCLNRWANCRKAAKLAEEEGHAQLEAAGVYRYFIEHREEIEAAVRRKVEAQAVIQFPERKTA